VRRLLIQPRIADMATYAGLVKTDDVYLELIEFSHANLDAAGLRALQERYLATLDQALLSRVVTFHGAFMDLTVASPDLYIAEASRRRVLEGLELAAAFRPEYILFHSNLLPPLATYEGYEDAFVAKNAAFWAEMLEHTESTILIENMFDSGPSPILRLLREVDADRLKACLNVGHANVFSRVPMAEWFDALRDDLVYFHFSDNDGTWDASYPPGHGTVDWGELSGLAAALPHLPDVLMGIAHRGVGAIEEGIRFLRAQRVYPFDR
jgi:sugar phosphate isomerase/epimerase